MLSTDEKNNLEYKYVIEQLKINGIGLTFLIEHKEIEFVSKVGEGAYGEVYRGKWLGMDVAIKQYGKRHSKLHRKKIMDFIKEVTMINGLRHPNIVLYMGICIWQS